MHSPARATALAFAVVLLPTALHASTQLVQNAGGPEPDRFGRGFRTFDKAVRRQPIGPTGAISGSVTRASDAQPLSGTSVAIYDPEGALAGILNTNAAGHYEFSFVPPGTYFARSFYFGGGDLIDELYDNILCVDSNCDQVATGRPIVVSAGSTTPGIDFALEQLSFEDGFESGSTGEWSATFP